MILQLVSGDPDLARGLKDRLRSLGMSLVHYTDPIKAMDNLKETSPKVILYSYRDFPRHWKVMIRFLKEELGKAQIVFILFTDGRPEVEEASKAAFLGVNAFVDCQGNVDLLARQVKEIYSRYGAFESDGNPVYVWEPGDTPLGFLFRHPVQQFLIPGRLIRLERDRGVFKPENRQDILSLEPGTAIPGCSLFIDDQSVFLDARVEGNTGQLLLNFTALPEKTAQVLEKKLSRLVV